MTVSETALNAFAATLANFDSPAAERLLAPDDIQHNVAEPTGAAPILGLIPAAVEHQDVISDIPEEMPHDNGKL